MRRPFYDNVVQLLSSQNTEHVNYVLTYNDSDGVSGLNDSQWRSIVNLLNANTNKLIGKISVPFWIMDTGASHHLRGKFDIFTDIRDIAPVMIILTDGRERISVKEGTVRLGHNLILHSVFYVEEMHSDLISLGQLMMRITALCSWLSTFFVVQDHTSRMIIRAGKRVGGTFHFHSMEIVASVTTKDDKSFE